MGERVLLGIAFAKAAGGVDTQGREGRGRRIRGRDYCGFGSRCKRELSHGRIWVHLGMDRCWPPIKAVTWGAGSHVVRAGAKAVQYEAGLLLWKICRPQ